MPARAGAPIKGPILMQFDARSVASLSPGVVPCRGLRDEEWRETQRRCQEFVERWGMQAYAAGWDTLRLFGMSADLGTIRGDFCGHLILLTRHVQEVTAS